MLYEINRIVSHKDNFMGSTNVRIQLMYLVLCHYNGTPLVFN